MTEMINFTVDKLKRFKRAYNRALANGTDWNEAFTFEGKEWVVGYAKYVIEYLEEKFNFKRKE